MNSEFENFILECFEGLHKRIEQDTGELYDKSVIFSVITDLEFNAYFYGCFVGCYGFDTANALCDDLTKTNLQYLLQDYKETYPVPV